MLRKIKDDLFDIANRLKEIDERYEVFFDTSKQKFVLYAQNAYQLTIPFENLDARTIDLVRYTRAENVDTILRDVDKENKKRDEASVKRAKDKIEDEYSRRLRLSHRKGEKNDA